MNTSKTGFVCFFAVVFVLSANRFGHKSISNIYFFLMDYMMYVRLHLSKSRDEKCFVSSYFGFGKCIFNFCFTKLLTYTKTSLAEA